MIVVWFTLILMILDHDLKFSDVILYFLNPSLALIFWFTDPTRTPSIKTEPLFRLELTLMKV